MTAEAFSIARRFCGPHSPGTVATSVAASGSICSVRLPSDYAFHHLWTWNCKSKHLGRRLVYCRARPLWPKRVWRLSKSKSQQRRLLLRRPRPQKVTSASSGTVSLDVSCADQTVARATGCVFPGAAAGRALVAAPGYRTPHLLRARPRSCPSTCGRPWTVRADSR